MASLWDWAGQCWRHPALEQAALALQEQQHVSVPLWLAAAWVAAPLPAATVDAAQQAVAAAQPRIDTVRSWRGHARAAGWLAEREALMALELAAEQALLAQLEQLLAPYRQVPGDAAAGWRSLFAADLQQSPQWRAAAAALRDASH